MCDIVFLSLFLMAYQSLSVIQWQIKKDKPKAFQSIVAIFRINSINFRFFCFGWEYEWSQAPSDDSLSGTCLE